MIKQIMDIQQNILLAPYTYIKIGGPARYFVEVITEDELQKAVLWARERRVPVVILGAGSNVLIADKGFAGLVIRMRLRNFSFTRNGMRVGAGVMMAQAAHIALENNRSGLEWAVGIPGAMGGSVYGNAGCFGGEIKDLLEDVRVFDITKCATFTIPRADCAFNYRGSIFKKRKDWVILGASFNLQQISDAEKKEKQEWIQRMMRERIHEQAIGERTMGSTFKGVRITEELLRIAQSYDNHFKKPERACWLFENRAGMMSAGFLIERAGLKGKTIGGVSVATKHANFLIADDTATAEHVVMLIALIKEHVHRTFGIMLEEEVQYIN
jgi:UDP-N-acetylmuramate dehydrogenase